MPANKYKPLGRKAYGSIPHLPGSRLGPADRTIGDGQAAICLGERPGRDYIIFVTEKLDGSCCAVANVDGYILALQRKGHLATDSKFHMHHAFAKYVKDREAFFRDVLMPGERMVGEWCLQAHGTHYDLDAWDEDETKYNLPWFPFDMFDANNKRVTYDVLRQKTQARFPMPALLDYAGPHGTLIRPPIDYPGAPGYIKDMAPWEKPQVYPKGYSLWSRLERAGAPLHPGGEPEGLVFRVERNGKFNFLAKWVQPKKKDGIYLPHYSGKLAVWNVSNPVF